MTDWTGQRKIYNIKVVVVIAIVWFIQHMERRLENVKTTKDDDAKSIDLQATETHFAKVKKDAEQKDTFKQNLHHHNRCQCVKIQRKNYTEIQNNDGTDVL